MSSADNLENEVVVIRAPEPVPIGTGRLSIFLAGSIEMGKATDWQSEVTRYLQYGYRYPKGITVLNPRRDNWDSSWEQTIDNDQFRQQVSWELEAMEIADRIIMYFEPSTKSPITLLELGLAARYPEKTFVVCPNGFWRKGNVDITCRKYGIRVFDDITLALYNLQRSI